MAIDWGAILNVGTQALTGNVMGAVGTAVTALSGSAKGKGALIGGTITDTYPGHLRIKTSAGNIVTIKRAKHRRQGYRRGGGMNSMLKQAMQFKMLSQAMK